MIFGCWNRGGGNACRRLVRGRRNARLLSDRLPLRTPNNERQRSAAQHRGAEAEVSVHELIKKNLPAGWSVRSGIAFQGFDLDHLIIGDSCVIEVETKSTGGQWNVTADGVKLFAGDPTLGAARRLKRARQFITGGRSADFDGASWLVVAGPTNDETRSCLPAVRNGVTVCQPHHLADLVSELPEVTDLAKAQANLAKVDVYLQKRAERTKQDRTTESANA